MSKLLLLWTLSLQFADFSSADSIIPEEWRIKVEKYNALFAENDDDHINLEGYPGIYTPLMGNGYLSHSKGVRSDTYFVSGLFNGETTSPSHRARIPATFAVKVENTTTTGTLLDMKEGTFHRRGNLTSGGDWYELRWYAHMTFKHLYVMEFEVHFGLNSGTDNISVQFSNNAGSASTDIAFQSEEIDIDGHGVTVSCGSTLEPETVEASSVEVCVASRADIQTPFTVSRQQQKSHLYTYVTAMYTSLDSGAEVRRQTLDGYDEATKLPSCVLRREHVESWAAVWESGIEVVVASDTQHSDVAVAVNASLFAILSSVREDWAYGLAPGGLTNYYNGHSFWDTETWMYPSLLLLHPSLARSLVQYRANRLDGAYAKAKTYTPPYEGAMFPWESALTGVETCPEWAATGLREQHISADISLSVWQYYSMTNDVEWLKTVGMPILTGVADFLLSRAEFDESRETAHINGVIPPDEYVDMVDDSVYTNFAAAEALRFTLLGAAEVGVVLERANAYSELASALVILFDEKLGVHPEYLGYNGSTIKQADAVMLHFPWGLEMEAAVQQADLEYYAARSDENGPAMTWSMHAIGFKDLGMITEAGKYFVKAFQDNMQPPFMVWTETPTGDAGNFITGAGGFLQTMTFGYPGLRIEDERLLITSPSCPEGTSGIKLRGMWYLGSRMDVSYHCSSSSSTSSFFSSSACADFLADEITVHLTTINSSGDVLPSSLSLLRYDPAGVVVASEELTDGAAVTMSVPCDVETAGSTFAIIRT